MHPKSSKGMAYIIMAIEHLAKWTEAKAMRMDTAANAAVFYTRTLSPCLDALGYWSAIEAHNFLNSMIGEITEKFRLAIKDTTPYHK